MQPNQNKSPERKRQNLKSNEDSVSKIVPNSSSRISIKHSSSQLVYDEPISLNLLTPANPIVDKSTLPDAQINMKLLDRQREHVSKRPKYVTSTLTKSKKLEQQFEKPIQTMTLFNGYDLQNMLYRKFNNLEFFQLNKKKYFASIFYPIYLRQNNKFEFSVSMPIFQGMKKQQNLKNNQSMIQNLQDQLEFNSNFQSGNLFAVFKTGLYTYDLILQNDMNTTGCTQWFYFSVKNKKNKDIMVKFNIVNLYKAASLYNQGMKPVVLSNISAKGWKRKGQNIFYEKNCIRREKSSKFYSSLSFSYDFTKQNDTVEFAHAIPYSYSRLQQLLKTIQTSKKCIVKSLGLTPLKKTLPIIKFESQDKIAKKAIIFMARQHPGQVQGSFAIEQILLSFLKSSTEIDFLLWRFNIYFIPMINVDGVFLGNYRCNAMGFDLNRNWQGQQKSKHPQIIYIKNEIKRIMLKQPIELIIDLHGHSNKMNSFFYGNPFGPNPFVFPYIASKTSSFIAFEECTFNIQKKQKAKTARSVLGNMIKQTGNVYTYEMSFYGGTKNGKVINFYEQNFRDLGRDLLSAIYKVYVEMYKQQKTLKQSLYLKEIRKEISKIEGDFACKQFSGSDSQAEQEREEMQQQRKQEIQQKLKEFNQQKSRVNSLADLMSLRQSEQLNKSYDDSLMKIQSYSEQKYGLSYQSSPITERMKRNKSLKPNYLESIIVNYDDNLQEKINKHKKYAQKLKIFGQNVLPKPVYESSLEQARSLQGSQRSILKVSSIFQDKSKQSLRMNFVIKTRNNKNRIHDFSTLSPLRNERKEDESIIKNIVRVNRLQYKKIERQKDKLRLQKSIQSKNSNKGVFKLPSIVNNFKL